MFFFKYMSIQHVKSTSKSKGIDWQPPLVNNFCFRRIITQSTIISFSLLKHYYEKVITLFYQWTVILNHSEWTNSHQWFIHRALRRSPRTAFAYIMLFSVFDKPAYAVDAFVHCYFSNDRELHVIQVITAYWRLPCAYDISLLFSDTW